MATVQTQTNVPLKRRQVKRKPATDVVMEANYEKLKAERDRLAVAMNKLDDLGRTIPQDMRDKLSAVHRKMTQVIQARSRAARGG